MLTVIFTVLQILFAVTMFFMVLAFVTGAPFVPSSRKAVHAMIDVARIKPGMVVYDLGSGDGRLLFAAAKIGAEAYGYEINLMLAVYSKIRALLSPYRNKIHVHWKSFWKADVSKADRVFIYLLPHTITRIYDKLIPFMHKDSLIITNSFAFKELTPTNSDTKNHVYVYKL